MHRWYKFLGLLFISFVIWSCHKENENRTVDFYFWRTHLELDVTEQNVLKNSNSKTLYTRFFDVDKVQNKILPKVILNVDSSYVQTTDITPVIFITNRTWLGISAQEISELAKNIDAEISRISQDTDLKLTDEVQFDSDWTQKTKDDYFRFLKTFKEISKKTITSTIRLHQIKDVDIMGIPPVSKGVLMCYATSSPLKNQTENSILDLETLKAYTYHLEDYPLVLDFALPIYSWGIVTNHFGKKRLINGLSNNQLEKTKGVRKTSENIYRLNEDGFYFGSYLSKGFQIKIEEMDTMLLKESLHYLDQKFNRKVPIIYYHLDSRFTQYVNLEL